MRRKGITAEKEYVRSDRLLKKQLLHYLFPMLVTLAALSLNEFADSMMVARLLGSDGMAIVNLGAPIMMIMAVLFTLCGTGGSVFYAISLGKNDRETAGRSFTCSIFTAVCAGLLMMVVCFVFKDSLFALPYELEDLKDTFESYFRVLLISAPLLVPLLTFVQFLSPAGLPGSATAVNVVASVVNIVMDYVYIHVFGMNVDGAAWATLTGYICGLLVTIFILVRKKPKVYISKDVISSMRTFGNVFKQGAADVMTQFGFAIQIAACNTVAAMYAGHDGVVSYSFCMQSLSISTIFLGALIGAYTPMIAVLHGQRDYRGEGGMLKLVLKSGTVVAAVCAAAFMIFAPWFASLYNITEGGQMELAIHAFRIFALCVFLRGPIILYFRYLKVIGKTAYSILIGAMDGFLTLLPIVIVITQMAGIDGIWWGYAANAALIIFFIIIFNTMLAKRSKGKLRGLLLLEYDIQSETLLDVTITKDHSDIAGAGRKIQQICEGRGIERREAMYVGLAVEEMALYAANAKKQDSYMDVLVRSCDGDIEIDFRSVGERFDSLKLPVDEIEPNIRLLQGISDHIENEYIMGMNLVHIIIR